ncbi:alpha/beta hydrolase [Nocardia sp. NEAU-G5]|uniref:Alpha/beta hydrolase n=1 Tax=Nocardia albiluteola TaxID=2842303 RepID=A0ABS6B2V7_9NOCA|nr:alpha/beta hydrolase [Nocardia albiluteola]MBU3064617.1 alpha/beta hydrolase [Nocardia albiluteola]
MTTSVTTHTLAAPGVRLYYELRGDGPLLALVGSPMHSAPFIPLAEQLAEQYTVLTPDPRGHFGSELDDPGTDATPELRADDLARILRHLDAGPATVLGSSGGAVTTLALLQAAPELVSTAIAHEPPLAELLDDRESQRRTRDDIVATFHGDEVVAIRKFFAMTEMPFPEGVLEQMLAHRDAANDRFFYLHELEPTAGWRPDLDALRALDTHVVLGIGDTSAGLFCDRTTRALAAELKIEPTLFPGGHAGFMENPPAFAARLHEVIE